MKRKDLILKTKGDVIAEADSFGHGGGFVAVADLTEFKRAVAIGLDLVEISAHADSEQDGIRRAEGLFTSLDILNQYTLGGDADALAVDERLGGALFEILLVDGGVVQVGRAKADLVAHFHDRDAFALLLENETPSAPCGPPPMMTTFLPTSMERTSSMVWIIGRSAPGKGGLMGCRRWQE